MQTKAEANHIGIVNQMRPADKDRLILNIMDVLDSPREWSSETIEHVAEQFTRRGFIIRDPNDKSSFEPSELEG